LEITVDQYKNYGTQEMINALMSGSLMDEGIDNILLKLFIKAGTNLLVDIGCNQGNYIKFQQENFPNLNILAFEPDTRIYNECLSKYNLKNVVIFNEGIANKNGKMKFYFDDDSTQTSNKYSNSKNYMITKVEKLDNYFNYIRKFKNPYIKIDAEGLEPEIIYSLKIY